MIIVSTYLVTLVCLCVREKEEREKERKKEREDTERERENKAQELRPLLDIILGYLCRKLNARAENLVLSGL